MVGPDGSLCRITSSAEDYKTTNIYFIKVPDDQREEFRLPYKLVIVGGKDSDLESPSEKSDDEDLNEDLSNFEFFPKNVGKVEEKVCEANDEIAQTSSINKLKKGEILEEQNKDNKPRPKYHKSYQGRNHKNSYQGGKKYSKHISNSSKTGEMNYVNYNSKRRNFHPPETPAAYNNPVQNFPSADINPWITPPPPVMNYDIYSQTYPYYGNPVETVSQSPINSCPEKPKISKGLLGESPYSHPPSYPPNFQQMNQTESYISDQNYWGTEYSGYHGGDFQSRGQSNRPVSGPAHRTYYSQAKSRMNKKRWNSNRYDRKKPNNWNQRKNYRGTARNPSDSYKN